MMYRNLLCGLVAAVFATTACSDTVAPTNPGGQAPGASYAKGGNTGSVFTKPVTGTYVDPVTQATGTFAGTFTVTQFSVVNGTLSAVGTLSGTFTPDALTGATQTITKKITLPVTNISGSCTILHLELGPLDLTLLGLQVHLDRVVLDISAQTGPGNLLGNLLCTIAGALDGGNLNLLANLLNQLLALLK